MANMKKNMTTLSVNQNTPSGSPGMGDSQPPKNRVVISAHISVMAMYSPIMNSRYGVEEYSTW